MAWHLGYPLSQTLFTNVYIEAILMPTPATIADADFVRDRDDTACQDPMLLVLRAYCLGLLKACGWVNEHIKAEHFYEARHLLLGDCMTLLTRSKKEEDFVTNTYNRTLLEQIDAVIIQQVILDCREMLKSQGDSVSADLVQALDLRLLLRHILLDAIDLSQHQAAPNVVKRVWQEGFDLLARISQSHSLSKSVPDAFSEKLQRKLASTMPPRPIVQLSFEHAFGHLARLFSDAIEVTGVLNYTDSQCLQVCPYRSPNETHL
jgi:N-alpha-acetyltransferase 35, NatC auxiliary subunit